MPYIHIRVASEYLSPLQIRRLSAGTTTLMAERLRKRIWTPEFKARVATR